MKKDEIVEDIIRLLIDDGDIVETPKEEDDIPVKIVRILLKKRSLRGLQFYYADLVDTIAQNLGVDTDELYDEYVKYMKEQKRVNEAARSILG